VFFVATEEMAYEIVRRMRRMAGIKEIEEAYSMVNK
jgi:hypothetical protein